MEFWVDTNGDKRYDPAGVVTGGRVARKVTVTPIAHGVNCAWQAVSWHPSCFGSQVPELITRMASQVRNARLMTLKNLPHGVRGRVIRVSPGRALLVAMYLSPVSRTPKRQKGQAWVLRYNFDGEKKGLFRQWSTKGDVFAHRGVIKRLPLANPQGETFEMWFELGNKTQRQTPRITISGNEGKNTIDINPRTMPAIGAMEAPLASRCGRETKTAIKGDILWII